MDFRDRLKKETLTEKQQDGRLSGWVYLLFHSESHRKSRKYLRQGIDSITTWKILSKLATTFWEIVKIWDGIETR